LKLQKRNLVVVETVAEAAVDAEMVVLSEVNFKETEIVHHAAVMVEIVEKVVLPVIEMVEEIVMAEEIVHHEAVMADSETMETIVAEHLKEIVDQIEEMVDQKEMAVLEEMVVRKEMVAVAQDHSVNLLIKIKNNKQYFYL
jgi:hypothetical protein